MNTTPQQRLGIRADNGRAASVASFEEAAAAWNRIRTKTGVPASRAPRITVVDLDSGEVLARIAYNGSIIRVDKKVS